MANNSYTSSDERAQRVAELKRKMQEAAKKAKAEHAAADASDADAAPEVTEVATQVESSTEEAPAGTEEAAESVAVADIFPEEEETVEPKTAVTASVFTDPDDVTPEMAARRQMNRREFLTYAWGAALGLVVLQVRVVSFFFMYPRFKAGEFGGAFFMGPESATPPPDAEPIGVAAGKFWWLTVEEEGPRAIFMVCTHLGCLYKWVGETNRFECPCHGSKFTREGNYIEGPAPRSLDEFQVALVDGEYVVDTGSKINGAPASESPAASAG